MSFESSPFAKSLYLSGTPKKGSNSQPSTPTNQPLRRLISGTRSGSSPDSLPATPIIPNAYKPSITPNSVPTGYWEHPSLKEIRKRTVNKELVLRQVFINAILLAGLYMCKERIKKWTWIADLIESYPQVLYYTSYLLTGFQLLLVYNILAGIKSLIEPQEKFDDLPITPHQRKLLGLPDSPTSSKSTPSPPKYLKSSPHARTSPRPSSPLSHSPTATTPISKLNSSTSTILKGSPSTPSPVAYNLVKRPTGATVTNVSSSATNSSPKSSQKPSFTPSGRFMYMTDSPKRSPLRHL
jgi:nucleoporin POM34